MSDPDTPDTGSDPEAAGAGSATESTADAQTDERIADAPLPTGRTLWRRQSLAVQSWRFVRINLRMLRMILRGGHH